MPASARQNACEKILRSLPKWFGLEDAIQMYIQNVQGKLTIAAFDEQHQLLGFLSLDFHFQINAEIYVMGVFEEAHGRGIGKALVNKAAELATQRGFKLLSVKTLSPAREDQNYEKTRKFYEAVGFVPFEEFKTLWGESNPCLEMVRFL